MSTRYLCPYCRTQQPSRGLTSWSGIGPTELRCKNCGRFYKTGRKEWNEVPWLGKFTRCLKVLAIILLLEISLGGPALYIVMSTEDIIGTPVVGLVVMGIGAVLLAVLIVRSELKAIKESKERRP